MGAADLRVNVDQGVGLFNGYVDYDNQGSRFTGEHRFGASLNVNNPLTIGDQLTVRGFTSDGEMNFGRVAYLVPVGFWGTRLGASVSKFDYALGKDFADAWRQRRRPGEERLRIPSALPHAQHQRDRAARL